MALVYWKGCSFQLTTIKTAPYTPRGVDLCTYTSRHATQVNSNGGSGIPISDWLSPKNQRGILNLNRKSGVIVLNSGVFLQNREFGCYLESRSGNRELRVKSGKSRTNRESWHVWNTLSTSSHEIFWWIFLEQGSSSGCKTDTK